MHVVDSKPGWSFFSKTTTVAGSGSTNTSTTASYSGGLTKDVLAKVLPPPSRNALVLVCGRPQMTAAIAGPKTPDFKQGELGGLLLELGYAQGQVWKV